MEILGTNSVTVRELKRLFGLLKTEPGDFRVSTLFGESDIIIKLISSIIAQCNKYSPSFTAKHGIET